MIVHRNVVRVKDGHMPEALAIAANARKLFPSAGQIRHYTAVIGPPSNVLVFEIEFESLADLEASWARWTASDQMPQAMGNWNEIVAETLCTQVWELH